MNWTPIFEYVDKHKRQPGWIAKQIAYYTSPMPVLAKNENGDFVPTGETCSRLNDYTEHVLSHLRSEQMNALEIEVHEKYYRVEHLGGFVEIVRRDSKCTSGYMNPGQLTRIKEIEARLERNKSVYINIDTNPDPDCIEENFAVYLLHYPCDAPWSLDWCDDENFDNYQEVEDMLCEVFGAQRAMEGCFVSNYDIPADYEARCKAKNIIINKVGERLEEC